MSLSEVIQNLANDRLLQVAIPFFILLIIIEYRIDKRKRYGLYKMSDTITSLGMGILSIIVEFLPKVGAFFVYYYIHEANLLGLRNIIERQWWAWILLFFADDFTYYWFHRLNHEVRILWAGHISHHSSQYLNFGTALRQGVGERLHKFFFWIWLPFLGFDPTMIFVMMTISLIYQYWIHTELVDKFPDPIEWFFNTASHHRVHHASQVVYLDRNHSGVLIIWDRIFGTFQPEQKELKPKYGLTTNIDSTNWVYVATHEYSNIWKDVKRAKKFSDKLKYIFYPPGWSHDGPDQRSKVLKKEQKITW